MKPKLSHSEIVKVGVNELCWWEKRSYENHSVSTGNLNQLTTN
jgi:hypothetical protein